MVETAASALAAYCADLRWDDLQADVRERTKELLLDHASVAVGGLMAESSMAVHRSLARYRNQGGSTVAGKSWTLPAEWAALANGTSAHALEMDDCTRESSLHPGAAVIPAALAVAEEVGASQVQLLEAIVGGYEVVMRVGAAIGPASAYRRGFHPTGVAGAFGAAASAGRLLGLDRDGLTMALGVAGTMASGSLEYLSDGSMTKRLNPGWASHAGVVAARLAQAGYTGPASALEGPLGALHAFGGRPLPEELTLGLGGSPRILRVATKPYACCRYAHPLIDAALTIRRGRAIEADKVAEIRLGVLSIGERLIAKPLDRKRHPRTVVDAQFSAPFAVATAVLLGSAGPEAFNTRHLDDPRMVALMDRIVTYRDAELDAAFPAEGMPGVVHVTLRDGSTLSEKVAYPLGEPENPLPRAAFVDRCGTLLASSLQDAQIDGLIAHFLNSPSGSVTAATALLRPPS